MNTYKYDSEALTSLIASFENQLDDYKTIVKRIEHLKNTIENSNEWVQSIKQTFINKYDEYLLYFNNSITKLESHLTYLKQKNMAMQSLEEAYS